MASDNIEFGPNELRIVGGDYGSVLLEGATPEARSALDALVASTRRGDRVTADGVHFTVDYCETVVLETRHAGTEGTPERGVSAVADGPDSSEE